MIMKKGSMLMMVMMTSTIIFAQSRVHDPAKRAAAQTEEMKAALSLTETQYATIKEIDSKYAARYADLRKDPSAQMKKHESMTTLRAEKEKEIQTVLSPAQKTKWTSYKADRAEKRKTKMKNSAEKFEARMKSELALSDAQLVKFKMANQNFRDKLSALKNQQDANTRDRAEIKKIKAEHDATIKEILSEVQFKKWTELKYDMKHRRHHSRK
jgi:protein CpxP